MVYCGKPSPACVDCRARRIKCDQLRPSCSQCLRADKTCSGYRDVAGLMFRDESERVVQKSKSHFGKQQHRHSVAEAVEVGGSSSLQYIDVDFTGNQARFDEQIRDSQPGNIPNVLPQRPLWIPPSGNGNGSGPPTPRNSVSDESLENHEQASKCQSATSLSSTPPPDPIALTTFSSRDRAEWVKSSLAYTASKVFPMVDDHGIEFFFRNYVTIILHPETRQFDPLSSPIYPLLFLSKGFFNAASCVGYAGLSNVKKDPSLMEIARRKYGKSIAEITADLKDVQNADLNATFKSVIVLAAFEIVNNTNSLTGGWGIHVQGGYEILKLIDRVRPGLQPAPLRMQMQFITSVYIKCIARGEPTPPEILSWTKRCKVLMTAEDSHAASLYELMHRFIDVSAQHKATVGSRTIWGATYEAVLLLDEDLEAWENNLPSIWEFTTELASPGARFTLRGQRQVPKDLWIARIYNDYRWLRIMVNELILTLVRWLGNRSNSSSAPSHPNQTHQERSGQQSKSLSVILKAATDICTSVPSHVDRHSITEALENFAPAMSGCFMLAFPLGVAASTIGVGQELHDWAINMLDTMGSEMGIGEASKCIGLMEERRKKLQEILGHEK